MADRITAVDGKPPIGDQYRFVDSPFGKGFLAPYVAFDEEWCISLRHLVTRSRTTGIIPMALIVPTHSETAIPSSMYTHETPYTRALEALRVAESAGLAPPGSVLTTSIEIINGNVIVEELDFGTEQPD